MWKAEVSLGPKRFTETNLSFIWGPSIKILEVVLTRKSAVRLRVFFGVPTYIGRESYWGNLVSRAFLREGKG